MRGRRPTTRRALLLPLLGAAHAAVLGIALAPGVPVTTPPAAAMTVVSVAAPAPAVAAEPVFDLAVATDVEAPAIDIAGDGVASSGCAMGDTISTAIGVDGAARDALATVPAEARSVANVVMLWDGRWGDGAWRAPLRRVVAASIRAAPADCRDAAVSGPRLLYVADAGGALILAVGSGNWKWSDLLA